MAFLNTQLYIARGNTNDGVGASAMASHTYISGDDTLAAITTSGYFPANFGVRVEDVNVNDLITIRGSDGIETYTISALDPVAFTASTPGGGDVDGAASSTDNAIVRFNGATGKLIQNSGVLVDDNNDLTIPGNSVYFGNQTEATDSQLHVQSVQDAILWLEADVLNDGSEDEFPVIFMSQDLNNTLFTAGFENDNDFVFNRTGNSTANSMIFKTGGTATGGGTAGVRPSITGGTTAMTLDGLTAKLQVGVGVELPTSGGTASTLDYYEESATNSLTITGAVTGSTNARITQIGNKVSITVEGFQASVGTPGTTISLSGIPARFRLSSIGPLGFTNGIVVGDNGAFASGYWQINDLAYDQIDIKLFAGTNFTGTSGFSDFTIAYVLD